MQIRGVEQAGSQRNVSIVRTKEGALDETNSILQKMRTLAERATSDEVTQEDRIQIQFEVDKLKEDINGVASDYPRGMRTAANINSVAAESRIRDAGTARDVLEATRKGLLSSPAESVASQANQSTQSVLGLLKG